MENYLEILKHEFSAQEGSFLLKLRCDLEWDQQAFSRLVAAMQTCCEKHEGAELIERWLADGFWYLSMSVRDHAMHPSFSRPYPQAYYDQALSRLDELALWFFAGSTPDMNVERDFPPM